MKCPYCNNNLNIEDKYCPYCGKENKFAKEHQESMEHYEADYTATKQDVIAETKRFQTKTIRITILAVMAAIAAGFFILAMFADDISYSRREKAVIAKSAHHKAAINALMEDRDYLAVDEYMDANHISYSDGFDEYYAVEQASSYYSYFYGNILQILSRRLDDQEKTYYASEEELLTEIGKDIAKINEARDLGEWYEEKGCYTPEKTAYLEDLQNQVAVLVSAYLNVPLEDAAQISSMSEARIIVLLEENYNGEKED